MSPESKRLLLAGVAISAALFLYAIRDLLPLFVLALLLVYLFAPVVDLLQRVSHMPRGLAVAALYLGLLLLLVSPFYALTPRLLHQFQVGIDALQGLSLQLQRWADQQGGLEIGSFTVRPAELYGQLAGSVQTAVAFVTARTAVVLLNIVNSVAWMMLVLVITFYLLKDTPRLWTVVQRITPPLYQSGLARVGAEVSNIFGTYLRGQLLLMLAVGLLTGLALAGAGLGQDAVWLGLIAGLLEIIPIMGPILAAIPGVLIAFFQEPTPWSLPAWSYSLLIGGLYLVIQQLENHLLLPLILGRSVNLHPAAVIFAVLAGATLGGVLGVFLAVPLVAALRVVGRYLLSLLLDETVSSRNPAEDEARAALQELPPLRAEAPMESAEASRAQ